MCGPWHCAEIYAVVHSLTERCCRKDESDIGGKRPLHDGTCWASEIVLGRSSHDCQLLAQSLPNPCYTSGKVTTSRLDRKETFACELEGVRVSCVCACFKEKNGPSSTLDQYTVDSWDMQITRKRIDSKRSRVVVCWSAATHSLWKTSSTVEDATTFKLK